MSKSTVILTRKRPCSPQPNLRFYYHVGPDLKKNNLALFTQPQIPSVMSGLQQKSSVYTVIKITCCPIPNLSLTWRVPSDWKGDPSGSHRVRRRTRARRAKGSSVFRTWARKTEPQGIVDEASSESTKNLDCRGRKWWKIEHNTMKPEKVMK